MLENSPGLAHGVSARREAPAKRMMDIWNWFVNWRAQLAAETSPVLVDAAVALGVVGAVTSVLRAVLHG
jgi:hypothetical protein